MLQSQNLLTSNFIFALSHTPKSFLSPPTLLPSPLTLPYRPITISRSVISPCFAQVSEATDSAITAPEGGPIELELPPSASSSSIFATNDDPSLIQVATSVLLTGSISIFLFRALRRRAKRSKELKFRSSGANKSINEEALDSLKQIKTISVEKRPASPLQALLGAIAAAAIALILYKFTTTIETSLNRQTLSDNFSVRQITITIRTIINGMCYLATFVFGANSIGLFLYSGQLFINSFSDDFSKKETNKIGDEQTGLTESTAQTSTANSAEESSGGTNEQSKDES